jgi:hypothetical protein
MSGGTFNPDSTLAVILGASAWPGYDGFQSSAAFRNSAEAFRDYLLATDGLELPKKNVKFLFDAHDEPPDVLDDIIRFVRERMKALKDRGVDPSDLIVYYVGHGGFANPSSDYFLAMRSTRSADPYLSSLPIISLSRALNEAARHLRRYLILDCCFAAAAYKTFQADGPLSVAAVKVADAFPRSGTALLCASGARDPAKAPPDLDRTMFTGALLATLADGDDAAPARLSLQDVGHLVKRRIFESFAADGVCPEVLAPEQRLGRVDEVPIFPNRATVRSASAEAQGETEDEMPYQTGRAALGEAEDAPRRQTIEARDDPRRNAPGQAKKAARRPAAAGQTDVLIASGRRPSGGETGPAASIVAAVRRARKEVVWGAVAGIVLLLTALGWLVSGHPNAVQPSSNASVVQPRSNEGSTLIYKSVPLLNSK